ncbi:hypothetical protein [Bacillus sp. ISL-46]|uniref:hypothetical protein n=1 Tax=Bacillus sp. ISL-46 TaxID=2819129 RepID=UPI001BE5B73B|nr:hypothetical protein [Bacillus sp. ISL-46]MBT2724358.1 hypothetical protein [Bacillus sp. ISL-46]
MILWDTFDKNEISLLIMNGAAYLAIWLLPNKLPRDIALVSLVWGFSIGILFDFTLGGGLMDFYRENDSNHYDLFDLVYYFLFAPFGYAFIYFYEFLKISRKTFIWYVITWSFIGIGAQWVFTWLDIIILQKGYKLAYSLPVFLIIQTTTGLYYNLVKSRYPQSN